MNRIVNVPTIKYQRSKFNLSYTHTTTLNAGKLVPLGRPIEVYPGDTFRMDCNVFARAQTMIKAPMDNLDIDVYFFYCPDRILWEHFEEFLGDNKAGPWDENQTEYNIPQIQAPEGGWKEGSTADHLGLPPKVGGYKVTHLPFRAYGKVFNEWFRDEKIMDFAQYEETDADVMGKTGSNYLTDACYGGELLPVAKKPDVFTTGTPEPQKGEPVQIPLGTTAPVTTTSEIDTRGGAGLSWTDTNGNLINYNAGLGVSNDGGSTRLNNNPGTQTTFVKPANLVTDLSGATAASIEDLRKAFQLQKFLERDALFGTRYREFILGHFGVNSPDARIDIPEYLGGKTIPITINPIVQTSGSAEGTTPQGNIAGTSVTGDSSHYFTKSFTEHGIIMPLACIRVHEHSYQQGIPKFWSKKTKFDLYDPLFAGFGSQPTLNKEIFVQGNEKDNEVFNYQEYGADLRYMENSVSGEMRSNSSRTQDVWIFADNYKELPKYSEAWRIEDKSNIDRTLAVTSEQADQFLAQFYFQITAIREVPPFSMPRGV